MTSCYFSWELWASKLPVSPPALETFRCRQPFSRLENFIHLGLPFLPKFVCVVKGKKKIGFVLSFTEKFQRGRKTPTISKLLRKAEEHCGEHEARLAVESEVLKRVSSDFCCQDWQDWSKTTLWKSILGIVLCTEMPSAFC